MTRLRAVAVVTLVLAGCSTAPEDPQEAAPTTVAGSPTSAATPTLPPSPTPSPSREPDPTPTEVTPTASPPTASPPTASPAPSAAPTGPSSEPFTSSVAEVVGHPAQERIVGVSWREGCPVPLEQLRYLSLSYVDLDGAVRTGELVVHQDVVETVLAAMRDLYELGFPITQMRLVDDFDADDDASMRADNTAAFNCRTVAGTDRWSNHAYGKAIDINPLRNPYVRGDDVDPPEGAAYADRSNHRPGMLHAGTPEVAAFTDRGWDWGGTWSAGQDYQHFSATGG